MVRGLVEASPRRTVIIDAVANALKARGFQRPPGSPRLVTRLRRIREIVVSPSGVITLAEEGKTPGNEPSIGNAATGNAATDPVADGDRQPDDLGGPDDELDVSEIDGNRRPDERSANPRGRRQPGDVVAVRSRSRSEPPAAPAAMARRSAPAGFRPSDRLTGARPQAASRP